MHSVFNHLTGGDVFRILIFIHRKATSLVSEAWLSESYYLQSKHPPKRQSKVIIPEDFFCITIAVTYSIIAESVTQYELFRVQISHKQLNITNAQFQILSGYISYQHHTSHEHIIYHPSYKQINKTMTSIEYDLLYFLSHQTIH